MVPTTELANARIPKNVADFGASDVEHRVTSNAPVSNAGNCNPQDQGCRLLIKRVPLATIVAAFL